eukprot:1159880-Pelagomonas_calceolata.AAC.6
MIIGEALHISCLTSFTWRRYAPKTEWPAPDSQLPCARQYVLHTCTWSEALPASSVIAWFPAPGGTIHLGSDGLRLPPEIAK